MTITYAALCGVNPLFDEYGQGHVEEFLSALKGAYPRIMAMDPLLISGFIFSLLRQRDQRVPEPFPSACPLRVSLEQLIDLGKLENTFAERERTDAWINSHTARELREATLHAIDQYRLAEARERVATVEARETVRQQRADNPDLFVAGRHVYDSDTLSWAKEVPGKRRQKLRGPLTDDVVWDAAMRWLDKKTAEE